MKIKSEYRVNAERIADQIAISMAENKEFFFFVHKSVDGDCIGSACGTAEVLRNLGARARVLIGEELPYTMEFMKLNTLVCNAKDVDPSIGPDDYIPFATDCCESHRMGEECGRYFDEGINPIIIDHHISVNIKGDRVWINGDSSSASELCYYVALILEERAGRPLIDERAAVCFLTGIVTDTGRFTYTNTEADTLICAGELMQLGGNISEICYNLFDRHTKENFDLITYLRSKAELYADGKISMVTVVRSDFEKYGADDNAIDVLPTALRNIDGVELSIVLREKEDVIRCNLRSQEYFDCSIFAMSFGGGGHKRAAGFSLPRDTYKIEDVAQMVVERAKGFLR